MLRLIGYMHKIAEGISSDSTEGKWKLSLKKMQRSGLPPLCHKTKVFDPLRENSEA